MPVYHLGGISDTPVIPITGYQPYSTARLCIRWHLTAMQQPNSACPELKLPAPGKAPPDRDLLGAVPPSKLWPLSEPHCRHPYPVGEQWIPLRRAIPRVMLRTHQQGSDHLRGESVFTRLASAPWQTGCLNPPRLLLQQQHKSLWRLRGC